MARKFQRTDTTDFLCPDCRKFLQTQKLQCSSQTGSSPMERVSLLGSNSSQSQMESEQTESSWLRRRIERKWLSMSNNKSAQKSERSISRKNRMVFQTESFYRGSQYKQFLWKPQKFWIHPHWVLSNCLACDNFNGLYSSTFCTL